MGCCLCSKLDDEVLSWIVLGVTVLVALAAVLGNEVTTGEACHDAVSHISPSMYVFQYTACSVLCGAVASWLLRHASSGHLVMVARYAAWRWLGTTCYAVGLMSQCQGLPWLVYYVLECAWYVVAGFGQIFFIHLIVLSCAETLERSAMHDLKYRPIRVIGNVAVANILVLNILDMVWVFHDSTPQRVALVAVSGCAVLVVSGFYGRAVGTFVMVEQKLRRMMKSASGHDLQELRHARTTILIQLVGLVFCAASSQGHVVIGFLFYLHWGHNFLSEQPHTILLTVWFFHCSSQIFGIMLVAGALTGALRGGRRRMLSERARASQRDSAAKKLKEAVVDPPWQGKVEELAHRGFTLRALFRFYRGLGVDYMPKFTPGVHKTRDVVRRAIIPLSADTGEAYAVKMMNGESTRPQVMVTHNWANLFRDLVAAIVADALGEDEYSKIASMLDDDIDTLESWTEKLGVCDRTYWVCAFSVSQHAGICGANPCGEVDPVDGVLHPVCTCGRPKFFNDTEPKGQRGESIACEMNKFDDMMAYLAATDKNFAQCIAVDAGFDLFNRAWCVAEIAEAHTMGMLQAIKCQSMDSLLTNEKKLHNLRVQDMKATRPEDVDVILGKIPDKEAFNERVQKLLFEGLFSDWRNVDEKMQFERIGRLLRWDTFHSSNCKASKEKLDTADAGDAKPVEESRLECGSLTLGKATDQD